MIEALKTAIYQSMSQDAGIAGLLGNPLRLHDGMVRNSVFPFAIWRRFEQKPIGCDYSDAFELYASIEVISKSNIDKEAKRIVDAINKWAIDAKPISSELDISFLMVAYSDVMRANDGRTMLGIVRLKLIAQTKGE